MIIIDGIEYRNASINRLEITTHEIPGVIDPKPGDTQPKPDTPPADKPPPPAAPPVWPLNNNPLSTSAPMGTNAPMQFDPNVQLSYDFRCPANMINVHPVTFKSIWFKGNRMVIATAILAGTDGGLRDYVISEVAGSMTAVNPYVRWMKQGLARQVEVMLDGSPNALKKDHQYYLNVKPSAAGYPVIYRLQVTPL